MREKCHYSKWSFVRLSVFINWYYIEGGYDNGSTRKWARTSVPSGNLLFYFYLAVTPSVFQFVTRSPPTFVTPAGSQNISNQLFFLFRIRNSFVTDWCRMCRHGLDASHCEKNPSDASWSRLGRLPHLPHLTEPWFYFLPRKEMVLVVDLFSLLMSTMAN